MRTFATFMSTANQDNLNILYGGAEYPSLEILNTDHNFYVFTSELQEKVPSNLHQLTSGQLPTSIGFDLLIVEDFAENTINLQSSIQKRLGIPTIRIYKEPPPDKINPQQQQMFQHFSGNYCVFFNIINYQNWIVNKESTIEIMNETTSEKWNTLFQTAHKG